MVCIVMTRSLAGFPRLVRSGFLWLLNRVQPIADYIPYSRAHWIPVTRRYVLSMPTGQLPLGEISSATYNMERNYISYGCGKSSPDMPACLYLS